jgi:hypothetical protein
MVYRGYHIEQFGDLWVISNLRRVPLCEEPSFEGCLQVIDNAHALDAPTREQMINRILNPS